jgi:hypothetical protein
VRRRVAGAEAFSADFPVILKKQINRVGARIKMLSYQAPLITNNQTDCSMVDGLVLLAG